METKIGMSEELYNIKLSEINKQYEESKIKLYKEYALSNAKFQVGDTITDGMIIIKIQSINTHKSLDLPIPFYKGIQLDKKFNPTKKQINNTVYQNRPITKLK